MRAKEQDDSEIPEEQLQYFQVRKDIAMYFVLIPIFSNTVMTCFLLRKFHQVLFCSFTFVCSFTFILISVGFENIKYKSVLMNIVVTTACILAYCIFFVKLSQEMEDERIKFLIFQRQETNQFKRIVNSFEEALIMVQDDKITFTNSVACKMFCQGEECNPDCLFD